MLGPGQPKLAKRFWLKRDIKWEQQAWLRTYLQHLRKQITLYGRCRAAPASRRSASPTRARSGTPRWNTYRQDFQRAWSDGVAGKNALEVSIREMTESEASQGQPVQSKSGIRRLRRRRWHERHHRLLDGSTRLPDIPQAGRECRKPVRGGRSGARSRIVERSRTTSRAPTNCWLRRWPLANGFARLVGSEAHPSRWSNRSGSPCCNLWSARAGSKAAAHLRNSVTGNTSEDRAVRGFFLTAALFFGGLAYLGGALMRMATTGMFEPQGGGRAQQRFSRSHACSSS